MYCVVENCGEKEQQDYKLVNLLQLQFSKNVLQV